MYGNYDEAAAASKAAWDTGDTDGAYKALLEARAFRVAEGTVEQMSDGTLQFVPNA